MILWIIFAVLLGIPAITALAAAILSLCSNETNKKQVR